MLALAGAEGRLLPPRVVLPVFLLAAIAQPTSWALLALLADQAAAGGEPGFSPLLGALHSLTLGVLLPVAMVAGLQILCVVTMRPPPPPWRLGGLAVLMVAGGAGVVGGALFLEPALLAVGSVAAAVAVAGFGAEFALLLIKGRLPGYGGARLALGLGLLALLGVAALAGLLGADTVHGFLPERAALAAAHAVLAGFGFMGLLVMGFGLLLLPMLAIAPPCPEDESRRDPLLAALALLLAVAGMLSGLSALAVLGSLVGLLAAGLHVRMMERMLRRRLRRSLGDAFVLLRLGWAVMLACLAVAALLAAGLLPVEAAVRVLGFGLLFGWLLSFLTGVWQRILPFLGSMHVVAARGRAVSPAELSWAPPLKIHLVCHGGAVAAGLAGAALGSAPLLQLAGAAGTLGGVAFLVFSLAVLVRLARRLFAEERMTR